MIRKFLIEDYTLASHGQISNSLAVDQKRRFSRLDTGYDSVRRRLWASNGLLSNVCRWRPTSAQISDICFEGDAHHKAVPDLGGARVFVIHREDSGGVRVANCPCQSPPSVISFRAVCHSGSGKGLRKSITRRPSPRAILQSRRFFNFATPSPPSKRQESANCLCDRAQVGGMRPKGIRDSVDLDQWGWYFSEGQ